MSDNSLIAALRKAARQASSKPEDRIEWKAADRIEALSTSHAGQEVRDDIRDGSTNAGVDRETAAWAWLDRKFGTGNDDPVDRAYDASEMVDAFHAGHAYRLAALSAVEPAGNGRDDPLYDLKLKAEIYDLLRAKAKEGGFSTLNDAVLAALSSPSEGESAPASGGAGDVKPVIRWKDASGQIREARDSAGIHQAWVNTSEYASMWHYARKFLYAAGIVDGGGNPLISTRAAPLSHDAEGESATGTATC